MAGIESLFDFLPIVILLFPKMSETIPVQDIPLLVLPSSRRPSFYSPRGEYNAGDFLFALQLKNIKIETEKPSENNLCQVVQPKKNI